MFNPETIIPESSNETPEQMVAAYYELLDEIGSMTGISANADSAVLQQIASLKQKKRALRKRLQAVGILVDQVRPEDFINKTS